MALQAAGGAEDLAAAAGVPGRLGEGRRKMAEQDGGG